MRAEKCDRRRESKTAQFKSAQNFALGDLKTLSEQAMHANVSGQDASATTTQDELAARSGTAGKHEAQRGHWRNTN